jgi:hypothetical protein
MKHFEHAIETYLKHLTHGHTALPAVTANLVGTYGWGGGTCVGVSLHCIRFHDGQGGDGGTVRASPRWRARHRVHRPRGTHKGPSRKRPRKPMAYFNKKMYKTNVYSFLEGYTLHPRRNAIMRNVSVKLVQL